MEEVWADKDQAFGTADQSINQAINTIKKRIINDFIRPRFQTWEKYILNDRVVTLFSKCMVKKIEEKRVDTTGMVVREISSSQKITNKCQF